MHRLAVVVLAGTVVAGAVSGLAASLPVTSAQLGSGIAPVTSCDTDGVNAAYVVVLGLVTDISVSGIADGSTTVAAGACDGERVHVEAIDSSGSVLAGTAGSAVNNGDTNVDDDVLAVPLPVPRSAADIASVRITITG